MPNNGYSDAINGHDEQTTLLSLTEIPRRKRAKRRRCKLHHRKPLAAHKRSQSVQARSLEIALLSSASPEPNTPGRMRVADGCIHRNRFDSPPLFIRPCEVEENAQDCLLHQLARPSRLLSAVRAFEGPLCPHINPQVLALLIEMAPLQTQRLRRIGNVPVVPLQLSQ